MARPIVVQFGDRFGMLSVVREIDKQCGQRRFELKCDCGNTCKVLLCNLRAGKQVSCGCFIKGKVKTQSITHGQSRSSTYSSWQHAKRRCFEEGNNRYYRYGARGITVCDRWKNSFEAFLSDMGERPKGMTLDRLDRDLHYSCGKCEHCKSMGWEMNCKWSTYLEQARNMSINKIVEWNGEKMTISALAELRGMDQDLLNARLRRGWSLEDAANPAKRVNQFG